MALLSVVRNEPKRNRCMLAFAYDAALRREGVSLASARPNIVTRSG
jgi:hypothetical protein